MEVQIIGWVPIKQSLLQLERELHYVKKHTLDNLAFNTRTLAKKNVGDEFVNRNKWTQGSVQVNKARPTPHGYSEVGSLRSYMADQELGNPNMPIKNIAQIETRKNESYEQMVKWSKRISVMKRAKIRTKNRRQTRLAMIIAQRKNEQGQTYLFEWVGNNGGTIRGLFSLDDSNQKMTMDHNLTYKTVKIEKQEWLLPAINLVRPTAQNIFNRHLKIFYSRKF